MKADLVIYSYVLGIFKGVQEYNKLDFISCADMDSFVNPIIYIHHNRF